MKANYLLLAFLLLQVTLFSQATDSLPIVTRSKQRLLYPSVTLQNPTGGGELGFINFGTSVQSRTRLSPHPDGSAMLYIGLGDPVRYIGAGATFYIYGLSNSVGERNNRGDGAMYFHINKFLFNKKLLLDAGVDNAYRWGEIVRIKAYITYNTSSYMSANYVFDISKANATSAFKYISITAGMGNGYYRSDKNYKEKGNKGFDPFLTLASPLSSSTNLIAEWNGNDIGVGISTIPFKRVPFMFAIELTDVFYGSPRVVTSASFPFQLFKIGKRVDAPHLRPVGVKAVRGERTI